MELREIKLSTKAEYKVHIKFIEPSTLETPAKCKENIKKSTPLLSLNSEEERGG